MVSLPNSSDGEFLQDNVNAIPCKLHLQSPTNKEKKYDQSLLQKFGKRNNGTLYYIDQQQLEYNGNGLPVHVRNNLSCLYKKTVYDLMEKKKILESFILKANQLCSEPTNHLIKIKIKSIESEIMELTEKVSHARQYATNEKKRHQILKQLKLFTNFWSKRKNTCIEFLKNIEDWSDGIVKVKKCIKGEGQIYIESDESYSKCVAEMYKRSELKRKQMDLSMSYDNKRKNKKRCQNSAIDLFPSFASIKLNGNGRPIRLYVNEICD